MDSIDLLLTRAVDTVYPTKEALEKILRSGKKLRLYQGFDPTGTQLHIGHLTGLMKLRQFQELGHHVIFLIGDGTGQAGDPSGKARSRDRYLTPSQLRENAKDYVLQAHKIVHFEGENAAEILYNGDWLNKLSLSDLLDIAGKFSLQQLEERDMFVERKKTGESINLREFLYPLLQGYDSVAMKVDLELGGSDQMFNMLCGRTLVREFLQKEKFVMTTPLLTDSQGRKIGKTEGNVIALQAPPNQLYGMIMSLSDDVIGKAFEYITNVTFAEVQKIQQDLKNKANPMVMKKKLAFVITEMLHTKNDAELAQETFESTFQKKEAPTTVEIHVPVLNLHMSIPDAMVQSGLVQSKSEAKRLIKEHAIELDGKIINDPQHLAVPGLLKIGKNRFAKLT